MVSLNIVVTLCHLQILFPDIPNTTVKHKEQNLGDLSSDQNVLLKSNCSNGGPYNFVFYSPTFFYWSLFWEIRQFQIDVEGICRWAILQPIEFRLIDSHRFLTLHLIDLNSLSCIETQSMIDEVRNLLGV